VINEKNPLQMQYELKKRQAKFLGRWNAYVGLFYLDSYFQQSNWNLRYSESFISISIFTSEGFIIWPQQFIPHCIFDAYCFRLRLWFALISIQWVYLLSNTHWYMH